MHNSIMVVPHIEKGTAYHIGNNETNLCREIAIERINNNKINCSINRKYSLQNDMDISLQGVLGEWAFHRMFDLDPYLVYDTNCTCVFTDHFDAIMPNGDTVDVKTSNNTHSDLIVSHWKILNPPDVYVLMSINDYNSQADNFVVSFHGFAGAKSVLNNEFLTLFGNRTVFLYPKHGLKTWHQLTERYTGI